MKLILIRDSFFCLFIYFLENGEYTVIHSCIHSFESNDSGARVKPQLHHSLALRPWASF